MTATIASILTPLGEGGIGVVGLLGPEAIEIANRVFRGTRVKDLWTIASGRICHGFVHDETGPVDEVIVHISRGETAQSHLVEINCHGGIVPVQKVLALCLQSGAIEATPEEFVSLLGVRRQGLDGIQREAFVALLRARTQLASLVLLDQLNGALSNALKPIVEGLKAGQPEAVERLRALSESARLGLALAEPRRLVVAGKPNVGKSTLVNALLAEERVLVHHLPGTTRDAVATMVEISGVPFELVDTAGIRETGHELEMLGVEQTWREIEAADLILLLMEGSGKLDEDDARILAATRNRDVIFVVTKSDLPAVLDLAVLQKMARAPLCVISAKTGAGLAELCRRILEQVGFRPYEPGRPIPFSQRQVMAIQYALDAQSTNDPEKCAASVRHLRDLLMNKETHGHEEQTQRHRDKRG